jgi:APA family basic amino acid/polyamine antiporter
MVSLGVMILRKKDPGRARPFRTPAIFLVAPLSIAGCVLLFINLNNESKLLFVSWTVIGLIFYFLYGYRHSNVARGIIEVPELDPDAPPSVGVGPLPGAPEPGSPQERA